MSCWIALLWITLHIIRNIHKHCQPRNLNFVLAQIVNKHKIRHFWSHIINCRKVSITKIEYVERSDLVINVTRKKQRWLCVEVKLQVPFRQLNIDKCKIITFCRKSVLNNLFYNISGSILARCDRISDLDVIVGNKLSFVHHIEHVWVLLRETLQVLRTLAIKLLIMH